MAMCINLTFKSNDEELKLYLEAVGHSSKGNWIKDCIKFYMAYGHLEKQLKEMISFTIYIYNYK